jgi:peroxiredoxin
MLFWKRSVLLLGATLSFAAAVLLTLSIGLPERAQFTGQLIAGELPIAPELGAIAPPIELPTLKGNSIDLSKLRGAPVLINFWATWCEPCRVEMPAFQAVYAAYQDKGLRILAVNLGETLEAADEWATKLHLTFDILLDPTQNVSVLYQLRGQPSTYVISPGGVITQIFYGPTTEAALYIALAPYFPN